MGGSRGIMQGAEVPPCLSKKKLVLSRCYLFVFCALFYLDEQKKSVKETDSTIYQKIVMKKTHHKT